ncbi:MAG: DEAD/DEAH box helicase [Bifidobacteriaceae bacterium]|nr:DEAD/DEAH box helicase [Bifidobacteriaceae bacterium]
MRSAAGAPAPTGSASVKEEKSENFLPALNHDGEPTFADFGVDPRIVEALTSVGITHPFPIQALTLPVALQGHDIIGQAKTGTGKTLGFGIPLLQKVISPGEPGYEDLEAPGKPQAVVILPTRELAVQVATDLGVAAKNRTVRILQVYGGRAYEPQVDALKQGVDVVVGTPGRMVDLLNQRHLTLAHARTVVLDEADEMLDLGFLPDVEKLLAATPAGRHTMLFSATMPGAVVAMARRYMTQATHIRAQDPEDQGATVANIKQVVYRVHSLNKIEVLARILQAKDRGRTIIFARTKRTAAKVADELTDRGFAAAAIHGDLGQGAREQAMRAFRKGKVDVLVATDVAARGIDVDDVTHVINYQCPEDEKIYLHRTGRTGRAGHKGTAVTFVDWDDVPRWGLIDKALDIGYPEPVETYHTSPHLFTDLDIPEGVTGVLPRAKRTLAGLDAEEVEDLGETGKRTRGGSGQRGGGHGGGRGGRVGSRSGGTRLDGRSKAQARAEGAVPDGAPSAKSDGAPQRRKRRRTHRSHQAPAEVAA